MESSVATPHHPELAAPLRRQFGASRASGRSSVLARTLFLSDVLAASLAASIGVATLGGWGATGSFYFVVAIVIAWPAIAFALGLYGGDDLRNWVSGVSEVPRGLVATLAVTWPLFGAASLLDQPSPILLSGTTLLLLVVLTSTGRAVARAGLHRVEGLRQRVLILGSGSVAGQIVDKVRTHDQFGLLPIGILDDEVHDPGSPDLPHLGTFADLDEVLDTHDVDRVVIAFSRASHEELLHCLRVCRDHGVSVDVIPRLFEFLDGVRALDHVGGLPVLSIGLPRLTRSAQLAKRALDFAGASLLLLMLSPVLLAVAVAIKAESRGPVFFRQTRAGRSRKVFQLVKFRSMYADAERQKQGLAHHNDVLDGVMFKMHDDPRITRVGRFLRRFSLDELPQLLNVLKGEMSLVGPRPLILPETDALGEDWHMRRLELRPGLTGPWQIYGRSQTPFQEMVRFDYQYVAGWSLARDIEILLATLPAVLSGRGAY